MPWLLDNRSDVRDQLLFGIKEEERVFWPAKDKRLSAAEVSPRAFGCDDYSLRERSSLFIKLIEFGRFRLDSLIEYCGNE